MQSAFAGTFKFLHHHQRCGLTLASSRCFSILNALPSSRASNIKKISESDLISMEGQDYTCYDHMHFLISDITLRWLCTAEFEKHRRDLAKLQKNPLKLLRRVEFGPRSVITLIFASICTWFHPCGIWALHID